MSKLLIKPGMFWRVLALVNAAVTAYVVWELVQVEILLGKITASVGYLAQVLFDHVYESIIKF